MTMVEKDPDDRYQTADEVIDALHGLRGDTSGTPGPAALRHVPKLDTRPKRTRYQRERRNRYIMAGVISALVLLVLVLLLLLR
jgi:hypothetical protein